MVLAVSEATGAETAEDVAKVVRENVVSNGTNNRCPTVGDASKASDEALEKLDTTTSDFFRDGAYFKVSLKTSVHGAD